MAITKCSDGSFRVSYSKRHPVTRQPIGLKRKAKTLTESRRIYDDLVIRVNDKIKRQIIPTWRQAVERYFQHLSLEDISKSTVYNRRKVIEHHTLEAWGDCRVDEISREYIMKLLGDRFSNSAESHKKFFIKCIKGVFQYAMDCGHIMRNPTPLLKFKVNEKIKSVLNEEQIVQLLRRAQELDWPWYSHYATALYTGMRNGELYALTWDKVDLDKRQILVNCSWTSKDGFKSTKSGDDRMVEIPKPLLPLLMELKVKSLGDDFVLPRMNKWDKGDQARELRFLLKAIGLPEIRFHDLRASWATLLLGKGVAPSKVMAMGGWRDMDTMMIYMRKAGIDIRNSTSCLDDIQTHGRLNARVIPIVSGSVNKAE